VSRASIDEIDSSLSQSTGPEFGAPRSGPQASDASRQSSRPTTRTFRADIEGLRAFAVVLVVLSHLKLWPEGGFVGVDVFFVISGFLITGLIVDEISKTGRLSFRKFYVRRARRILPASLTVLLATWIAAKSVFFSDRVASTLHDIWWSAGFGANINFARTGTDYFQTYQAPSLVQHYWSLAVEEQFYVVWPVLLLAVSAVARRRAPQRAAAWVTAAALAAVVASFAWCVYSTATSPAPAYFSTAGRAWELGVGAVLAMAVRHGLRMPPVLAGPLSLLGVAGIVGSAAILNEASTFPGPTAAFPVLAAGLVLLSGSGVSSFSTLWHFPLNNPVARYIGGVSFSLYLWHWPTIMIVEALVPRSSRVFFPLTISAMATLTLFSYYCIEETFRHKSAGKAVGSARLPRAASPGLGRHRTSRVIWTPRAKHVGVVAALCVCTLGLWQYRPDAPAPIKVENSALSTDVGPQGAALQKQIVSALAASSWPALSPSMQEEISNAAPPDGMSDCVGAELPSADVCTYGSPQATKLAVVVGDSTAQAYMEVLKTVVASHASDWRVRFIGMAGCNFLDYTITNSVKWVSDACPGRKQIAADLINDLHPDMVIYTNLFANQVNAATGSVLTVDEWAGGVRRYLDLFKGSTKDLVLLSPPAWQTDISTCYTSVSVPAECVSHVTDQARAYSAAARAITAEQHGHYIDSTPWFCVADACPAFVGSVATKKDIIHLTDAYADVIAPAVAESFAKDGLFGT
jgi:peptidoglycan/LPS O-acetylase OafA/YrhL